MTNFQALMQQIYGQGSRTLDPSLLRQVLEAMNRK